MEAEIHQMVARKASAPKRQAYVPDVRKEAEAAAILREQIADVADGDEDFIRDSIEGETSLFESLNAVAATVVSDGAMVEGIDILIECLKARKSRIENRIELKRALIASAMDIAGITKHEAPACTMTIKSVPPKVIVTEEADIPSRFYEAQEPKLSKAKVAEALKDRVAALMALTAINDEAERMAARREVDAKFPAIPGATLSNGGKTIQMKVK